MKILHVLILYAVQENLIQTVYILAGDSFWVSCEVNVAKINTRR